MILTSLLVSLALGQEGSTPYVRSRVAAGNASAQCLYWTVPTITWHNSSVGNPDTALEAQKQREFEAIRASFQSWQRLFVSCGNLRFSEGPLVDDRKVGYELRGDNNRNLVLFRSTRCSDPDVVPASDACWIDDTCGNDYDCWDSDARTIALTLTTYDEKSGIIYDSDIQLNASGFVFTTVDSPQCIPPATGRDNTCVSTDLQNTMTHEIGHLIGLDHVPDDPRSVMFPRAPSGETSKRTIDEGSHQFVCEVYPKGQPSQSCVTPTLDSSGNTTVLGKQSMGCSSSGAGAAWLPSMAGWALLAWRRRRGGARS
ncbi:matrixin family metalloprotease [Archangium violaceum]|uniref:myxosortase-dependent metalloprotease, MXAN_2677/MXAN_2678 family n=1 Tax=Archangium violaceum TaxID=83451 RepID=UPI00193C620A|nr:myxosortase-dependent metalloprotease, MXAN_2677/MXAN_2678 family [Archangium violaceum]QRK07951.1 matrixin family metalloprotease [Archangium violaceum]